MNNKDYLKSSAANDILRVSLPKPRLSKEISLIYMKHKRSLQLHKAMIPTTLLSRRSIPRADVHTRCTDRFDKLYETSPRTKKEKLREARLQYILPGHQPPTDGMFATEFKDTENRRPETKPSRCSSARDVGISFTSNESRPHRFSFNFQKSEHSLDKAMKTYEKENSHTNTEVSRCLRHRISRNLQEIKNTTDEESLYSNIEKKMLTKSFHKKISSLSIHQKNSRSSRHSSVPRHYML